MNEWIDYLIKPYQGYSAFDITLESVAALFGLLSVWYARKANIRVYPTGLISTTIYIYVTLKAGLYADSGINAYYSAMSIYGWFFWSGVRQNFISPPISALGKRDWANSLALLLVGFILLYLVLSIYTDSTVPILDSFTTATFFVGMWLMARKKVENWLFWIIGNLVSIPIYIYKGLGITALQFAVFLILAIQGWILWRKELTQE